MSYSIWIINQFANTPEVPGHIRQYELGQFLAKQGNQVEVFSSDYNLTQRQYKHLNFFHLWKHEKYEQLNWNWLYATPYQVNNWKRYLNILSFCITLLIVCLFKPKPNLIIGSSPQLLAAFTAWLLAKIKGSCFYLEVRDIWPQVLIELGGKSPQNFLVRVLAWIEKLLYRKSDRVIVLASGAIKHVQKQGAEQVHWLPNGPDLEQFSINLTLQAAKDQFNIPLEPFCLMYTGAHGTANALETIVEAARILDGDHPGKFLLILIGDGPDKQKLLEQGQEIQCLDFRPPIPKMEIPQLLQASDGLILTLKNIPLFHYGVSPNKLYDYYAAGKPVVVAVGGSVNQEVESNKLGFTASPENPEALANAIVNLAQTSPEERKNMGKRGQRLVHSTYSRSQIAIQLWSLIKEDLNCTFD